MRARSILSILVAVALVFFLTWYFSSGKRGGPSTPQTAAPAGPSAISHGAGSSSDLAPTNVYAHNLMLRKGPSFRVYVRWLRGEMARTHRDTNPSFDDPESFAIDIKTGVLRANIGDISNYLNASGLAKTPLKNVTLSGDGDQIKLTGTLHKAVPLPVELTGTIGAIPDNRIQIRVTKLNVLKMPFKALLGAFHVTISDLFNTGEIPGMQVSGNDILLDTQKLLPPPHIRGNLTAVRVVNPDLEEVYGDARKDVTRVEQWRNFLRLSDGTIDFGKLTMHHVDLIMVDISNDPWFDLDLNNYQAQLVNGYTRMTPQAGLQIFMPDLDKLPRRAASQNINIEWLKNRNISPPPDVISK